MMRQMNATKLCFALLLALYIDAVSAQGVNPELLSTPWKAMWITGSAGSSAAGSEYAVFKFRKSFTLTEQPQAFVVHVSADNRYKLLVNGMLVSLGPARGSLFYWNFETVDIAQHLRVGENTIGALVWNEGAARPEAQVSLMTGFILQGDGTTEEVINTNKTWKVARDESYEPLPVKAAGYYVAGPGEFIRMMSFVREWERNGFDDNAWSAAQHIGQGIPKGVFTFASVAWMLVPSGLPQLEMSLQRLASVRKSSGVTVPSVFPKSKAAFTIPPNSAAEVLLDNGVLTNAYLTLLFSGGRNANISLSYAEALYIHSGEDIRGQRVPLMPKGNRNEVEGKILIGRRDSILSDGSKSQAFTSLSYRTYRYVLLRVTTQSDPLTIDDIYGTFTGYPFRQVASIQSNEPSIQKNLEVGWRTARLCAVDTYMDCPYYEQLQYFGDTRIQALVTLFNTTDDRLVKNALMQGNQSRIAEGLTLSRFPTAHTQIIPPFSLWWIGMIHDYWMYRDDEAFVRTLLPGTRQVLAFFHARQGKDGSLTGVPYWVFTDWVQGNGWKDGMAPKGKDGSSSVLDIQLLWTYKLAAEMEHAIGLKELAVEYEQRAEQLSETVKSKYWDDNRKLFADTSEKALFSQHANALAILCGLLWQDDMTSVAKTMMLDKELAPASIYFKYYLHQAYVKAGFGNDFLSWMEKWNENLKMGLTTWAEKSDVSMSRSDCHAWGSSPNIEFYRVVLGIDSDAAGFKKVRVAPHLGAIARIAGTMPHPKGNISVSYVKGKKAWQIDVELPADTDGEFVWNGVATPIKSGKNHLEFD